MDTRLRRIYNRCAIALGTVVLLSLAVVPARGSVLLFTTTSDFTDWTNGNATVAPSTAWDADGVTTNGAGNNPGNSGSSINVGGTSTGGSLQLTDTNSIGYGILASSPGEAYNQSFMSAVDPGSIAAYNAASNYGNGTLVAFSSIMYLTYTVPTISNAGSYFQIGVFFNDMPDSYYHVELPSSTVSDGTVDGLTTYTSVIPYSFNAGSFNNLNISIFGNSNYVPTSSFYVDSIAVPEPVSALGFAAVAGGALLKRRRRLS